MRFGAYYLRLCLDRYGGDVATAGRGLPQRMGGTVDSLLNHEDYVGDGKTLPSFPYSRMNHYVEKDSPGIRTLYGAVRLQYIKARRAAGGACPGTLSK